MRQLWSILRSIWMERVPALMKLHHTQVALLLLRLPVSADLAPHPNQQLLSHGSAAAAAALQAAGYGRSDPTAAAVS
jgi:uncharacterized membrane protein YjfL (UPF0719 family)